MRNYKPTKSVELNKLFSTLADGKHPNALAMLGALSNVSRLMTTEQDIAETQRARSEPKKSCQRDELYHPEQPRCSCCG